MTDNREPAEGLTEDEIEAFAHRRATRYTHRSDPKEHSYAFVRSTLLQFAGDIIASLAARPAAEPVAWYRTFNGARIGVSFDRTEGTLLPGWEQHPLTHPAAPQGLAGDAELAELRKKAARYDWLRDGSDQKNSEATRIATRCYGLEWDAAIDAAMAKEQQS